MSSYFADKLVNDPDELTLDMWLVDQALVMTSGYVLDFSDATLNDFVRRKFGVDLTAPIYTRDGSSKAKRLRAFLRSLVPGAQAEALRVFWNYRQRITNNGMNSDLEPHVEDNFLAMLDRLEGHEPRIDMDVVEAFSDDPTLAELVMAIQREIKADAPHAALDRLHTYSMKKFADLLARDGETVNHGDALHSRAGRYINNLRRAGQLGQYSEKIAKSAVQVMEQFNGIRNNESLAHDNTILSVDEGRYVFESVTSLLRFIKSLDGSKFGR